MVCMYLQCSHIVVSSGRRLGQGDYAFKLYNLRQQLDATTCEQVDPPVEVLKWYPPAVGSVKAIMSSNYTIGCILWSQP